jgi:Ca2+-binding EF-hand superfamily protein
MLHDLQKQKLIRFFRVMDRDGDGVLDPADFDRVAESLAAAHGWEAGSPEYERSKLMQRASWQRLEPNTSAESVDLRRFLAYTSALLYNPGEYDQAVRAIAASTFDALDADGDDRITIEEQRQFYRAYGIDPALADRVFPTLDTNGDGYLSRAELEDVMSEFFFSADPRAPANLFFGPWM